MLVRKLARDVLAVTVTAVVLIVVVLWFYKRPATTKEILTIWLINCYTEYDIARFREADLPWNFPDFVNAEESFRVLGMFPNEGKRFRYVGNLRSTHPPHFIVLYEDPSFVRGTYGCLCVSGEIEYLGEGELKNRLEEQRRYNGVHREIWDFIVEEKKVVWNAFTEDQRRQELTLAKAKRLETWQKGASEAGTTSEAWGLIPWSKRAFWKDLSAEEKQQLIAEAEKKLLEQAEGNGDTSEQPETE
jgi:hypothetical protein